MRVLFTTPILEHPPAGGPQLRIENSIKALSRVSELYIVARDAKYNIGDQNAENFYGNLCKQFNYVPSVAVLSKNRYFRKIQKIKRRIINNIADFNFILNLVEIYGIDIIWFGYGNISFPLIKEIKKARPGLKVVCDTDSVWSRFNLRELPYEKDERRRTEIEKAGKEKEQEEREWVNLCEITTAVSEVDAAYYRQLTDEPGKIQIFSNVIDLKTYENPPPPPPYFKVPCILLAGTFGHPASPMDRAGRWVLNHVFPNIREEIPNIHFYIVGRASDQSLCDINDPDVTITGKLPSVLPYLCHATVALVPLMFESGTRYKILEAGACGVPIVSTTLGAEGIPVTHEKDILIADTPESFAGSVIRLIKDKHFALEIANNCRALVSEKYSVKYLETEAKQILGILQK